MADKPRELWIKPPNGEWFNYTGTRDASYTIGTVDNARAEIYNEDFSCFPPPYRRELGLKYGHEAKDLGYKMQWRPKSDPKWRDRELKRLSRKNRKEMYDLLPKEWDKLVPIADHFAHLSTDRTETSADLIAYTESEAKGAIDVQSKIKAGRYLKKYYPQLSSEEIRYYSEAVQALGTGLHITTDYKVAARVYQNGPNSCMKKHYDAFDFSHDEYEHPSCAYFAGDLALAYLGEEDNAHARCIVWPEKKVYGRIYGSVERMKLVLEGEGYTCNYEQVDWVFPGARMRIIYSDGSNDNIIWPYVDGNCYYTVVKGQDDIVYMGNMRSNHALIGDKREMVISNNEGGYSNYQNPFVERCKYSGEIIKEGDETCELHGYGTCLLSAISDGEFTLIDGEYYSNNQLYLVIEEEQERIVPRHEFVGYGYVSIPNPNSQIHTIMRKKYCFQHYDGWDGLGNKSKYVRYKGTYYLPERLLQIYPNLSPSYGIPEQYLTKEEDQYLQRRLKSTFNDMNLRQKWAHMIVRDRSTGLGTEAHIRRITDAALRSARYVA